MPQLDISNVLSIGAYWLIETDPRRKGAMSARSIPKHAQRKQSGNRPAIAPARTLIIALPGQAQRICEEALANASSFSPLARSGI